MLICFPGKGSGGGGVYGCGVWRVKSWVKNVPNTNKYIAIFPIKWGWSPLTYLPLVVIIFEKSIILFYWTPYRGIETFFIFSFLAFSNYWTPYRGIETYFTYHVYYDVYFSIEPLIGGLRHKFPVKLFRSISPYWTPYRGIETYRGENYFNVTLNYWTPYRGIETIVIFSSLNKICLLNPL